MTRPTPPSADPQLARDVAQHLERQRVRRRMIRWLLLLALVGLAALFLRFGDGFGLGGAGKGSGSGEAEPAVQPLAEVPGPRRCAVRVTAAGITVDGQPLPRDEAAAACKATTGADVVITGDAREGDWKDLKAALEAAGVTDIAVRQPRAGSAAN